MRSILPGLGAVGGGVLALLMARVVRSDWYGEQTWAALSRMSLSRDSLEDTLTAFRRTSWAFVVFACVVILLGIVSIIASL